MQAPNNELQYRLILAIGSNPFHLDDTGVLTVENPLDAETRQNYTVSYERMYGKS